MAKIKINNVRIKGIAACAPSKVEENSEYPYFDENEFENIIPSIGVERRHVARKVSRVLTLPSEPLRN